MISRKALCLVVALSPLSLGITDAAGADTQIYKCTQPNGTALYTDQPCKGGTAVDIRLGLADPAAPARLARAQAELDAAAAQQKAQEEMAAARGEALNRLQREGAVAEQAQTAPMADYPYTDYPYDYGPWGYGRSRGYARGRGSPPKQPEDTRSDEGRAPAVARGPGGRMGAR